MQIKIYPTEDFLEQKVIPIKMIKRQIEYQSEKEPNKEVCGFVVEKDGELSVLPMKNYSEIPEEEFYIPSKEFLFVKKTNNIVAVYHSHCRGGCEPSAFDLKTSDLICYPFVIYSLEKNSFHVHEPKYSDANQESVEKLKEELK